MLSCKLPSLHKIYEITGFHCPVFFLIWTESDSESDYVLIRISENLYSRIFNAVLGINEPRFCV